MQQMAENEESVVKMLFEMANRLAISTEKITDSTRQVNNALEVTSQTIKNIADSANVLSGQTDVVLNEVKKAEEAAEKGKNYAGMVSEKMNSIKITAEAGSNKVQSHSGRNQR